MRSNRGGCVDADEGKPMVDSTTFQLGVRRSAEMAAVFMIGDGLLGLLQPKRHIDLWRSDVGAVDVLVRPFSGRPTRRRAYGLLQVGAGLVLASMLKRNQPASDDRSAYWSAKLKRPIVRYSYLPPSLRIAAARSLLTQRLDAHRRVPDLSCFGDR